MTRVAFDMSSPGLGVKMEPLQASPAAMLGNPHHGGTVDHFNLLENQASYYAGNHLHGGHHQLHNRVKEWPMEHNQFYPPPELRYGGPQMQHHQQNHLHFRERPKESER